MHPRLRLVALSIVALSALAIGAVWVADRGGDATTPAPQATRFAGALRPAGIPPADFSLRDQDGRPARLADYRGRVVILTFMYSTCRDTCPAQLQSIRGALDDLGTDVPVLAVSVDPVNDTPSRARRFLADQRMTGRADYLLGTRRELAPVWAAYAIQPQRATRDHTAYAVLVDRAGRQRVGWPYDRLTVEGLTADLRRLLSER